MAAPHTVRWDAKRLLEAHAYPCSRVISVDRDSILFVGILDRPHTAWLHRHATGRLSLTVTDGFAATPPAGPHEAA